MKSRMLWGIGMAGVISVGVIAQTQDPNKSVISEDRKVTVKGCLTPDMSAAATSMNSFTLSQAEITKDEPVKSNAAQDMAMPVKNVAELIDKNDSVGTTVQCYSEISPVSYYRLTNDFGVK